MTTLKVVVSDHWFDEIKSGRKTHEYREICLFWIARLKKVVVSFKPNPFPLKEPAFRISKSVPEEPGTNDVQNKEDHRIEGRLKHGLKNRTSRL